MSTRRSFRKQRIKLTIGESGVEGKVVRWNANKSSGFIQPANGAAYIFFHWNNVPFHREKCVGVGRKVFFSVEQTRDGRLTAVII
jgi:cold shock CspA family protein